MKNREILEFTRKLVEDVEAIKNFLECGLYADADESEEDKGYTEVAIMWAQLNAEILYGKCESPIERMLLIHFFISICKADPFLICIPTRGIDSILHPSDDDEPRVSKVVGETLEAMLKASNPLMLMPQYSLAEYYSELQKRFDLVLWRNGKWLVVECDGYEFHTTPHNFANDRKLDRILASLNIAILRYTGKEIYADPIAVAGELVDFANIYFGLELYKTDT